MATAAIGSQRRAAWRARRRAAVAVVVLCGAIAALVGTVPSPAAAQGELRTLQLGTSVLGRPIVALERRGLAPSRHIVVVGVIHGDEPAGRTITDALVEAELPDNLALTVIPTMNPDGEALGRRGNARGVDLNRNFPHQWLPEGASEFTVGGYYPGPEPLSEPEARAVYRWLDATRPNFVIWYHQPWGTVVCDEVPSVECQAFAAAVDMPTEVAPRPGSAAQWASANAMASAVVELPEGGVGPATTERHVRAILDAYAAAPPAAEGEALPPSPIVEPDPTPAPEAVLTVPPLGAELADPATYQPLTVPTRILDTRIPDTRIGTGGATGPLTAGAPRRIVVPVPPGAAADGATPSAASVTLAATEATGVGHLSVGTDAAASSALNVQPDSPATSQHLIVPLERSPDGTWGFSMVSAGTDVHLVVDLDGLWWSGGPRSGLRYRPDGPRRVLDTRLEAGPLLGARRFVVPGLPADAEAVVLHVTALGADWLSVRPGDTEWAGTSSLNVHHGISNGSVTVRLARDDSIWLLSPSAQQVVIEVLGTFHEGDGLSYRAVRSPVRVFDTRMRSGGRAAGPLQADEQWTIDLSGVPAGTAAASLNVTSIGGGGGWSVLWGTGPAPLASVAQHIAGTVAAAAQSPLPVHEGAVQARSVAVGADLAVDFYGAYVPDGADRAAAAFDQQRGSAPTDRGVTGVASVPKLRLGLAGAPAASWLAMRYARRLRD